MITEWTTVIGVGFLTMVLGVIGKIIFDYLKSNRGSNPGHADPLILGKISGLHSSIANLKDDVMKPGFERLNDRMGGLHHEQKETNKILTQIHLELKNGRRR